MQVDRHGRGGGVRTRDGGHPGLVGGAPEDGDVHATIAVVFQQGRDRRGGAVVE